MIFRWLYWQLAAGSVVVKFHLAGVQYDIRHSTTPFPFAKFAYIYNFSRDVLTMFCLARCVAAPPMWRNDQRPQDVAAVEDDDVVFQCNVIGRPNPTVHWMYNAQSLDQGLSYA